jgi:hypothetical protein
VVSAFFNGGDYGSSYEVGQVILRLEIGSDLSHIISGVRF